MISSFVNPITKWSLAVVTPNELEKLDEQDYKGGSIKIEFTKTKDYKIKLTMTIRAHGEVKIELVETTEQDLRSTIMKKIRNTPVLLAIFVMVAVTFVTASTPASAAASPNGHSVLPAMFPAMV